MLGCPLACEILILCSTLTLTLLPFHLLGTHLLRYAKNTDISPKPGGSPCVSREKALQGLMLALATSEVFGSSPRRCCGHDDAFAEVSGCRLVRCSGKLTLPPCQIPQEHRVHSLSARYPCYVYKLVFLRFYRHPVSMAFFRVLSKACLDVHCSSY
jgi:hypothetical protein